MEGEICFIDQHHEFFNITQCTHCEIIHLLRGLLFPAGFLLPVGFLLIVKIGSASLRRRDEPSYDSSGHVDEFPTVRATHVLERPECQGLSRRVTRDPSPTLKAEYDGTSSTYTKSAFPPARYQVYSDLPEATSPLGHIFQSNGTRGGREFSGCIIQDEVAHQRIKFKGHSRRGRQASVRITHTVAMVVLQSVTTYGVGEADSEETSSEARVSTSEFLSSPDTDRRTSIDSRPDKSKESVSLNSRQSRQEEHDGTHPNIKKLVADGNQQTPEVCQYSRGDTPHSTSSQLISSVDCRKAQPCTITASQTPLISMSLPCHKKSRQTSQTSQNSPTKTRQSPAVFFDTSPTRVTPFKVEPPAHNNRKRKRFELHPEKDDTAMKRLPRETTVVVTEISETVTRRKQRSNGPAPAKHSTEGKTVFPVVSAANDINSSHVGCHCDHSRRNFDNDPCRHFANSSQFIYGNPTHSRGEVGISSGSCLFKNCSSSRPRSWHISRTCPSEAARAQCQTSGRELSMTHCIDELRSLIRVTVSDLQEKQGSQSVSRETGGISKKCAGVLNVDNVYSIGSDGQVRQSSSVFQAVPQEKMLGENRLQRGSAVLSEVSPAAAATCCSAGASLDPKENHTVRFFEEKDQRYQLNDDSHKMVCAKEESPQRFTSRNYDLGKSPENLETSSPKPRRGSLKRGRTDRGMEGRIRSADQEVRNSVLARQLETRGTSVAPVRNGSGCWQRQDRSADAELVQSSMGLVKTASCRQKANDDSHVTWKVVGSSVKRVSRQTERQPTRKLAWVETERLGHGEKPTVENGRVSCVTEHTKREVACGGQWKMLQGCMDEAPCGYRRQTENRKSRRYIHTLSSDPAMCQMTNLTKRSVFRNACNSDKQLIIKRVSARSDASSPSGNRTIQNSSPKSSLWGSNGTSGCQIRCKMDTASPRDNLAPVIRGSARDNRATFGSHAQNQEVQKICSLEPPRAGSTVRDCSVQRYARGDARLRSFRYLNNNKNSSCWSFEYLPETPDGDCGKHISEHTVVSDLNDDYYCDEFQIAEMFTGTCLSQSNRTTKHDGIDVEKQISSAPCVSSDYLNQNGCCSNQRGQAQDTRKHRKVHTTHASPSRPSTGEPHRSSIARSHSHRKVTEHECCLGPKHSLNRKPNLSACQTSPLCHLPCRRSRVQKRLRISEATSKSKSYSLTCCSRKFSDGQGDTRSTGSPATINSCASVDFSTRTVCPEMVFSNILVQGRVNTHTKTERLPHSPEQADGWLTTRIDDVRHRGLPFDDDRYLDQDDDCPLVNGTRFLYRDNSCYSSTLNITTPDSYIHESDFSGYKGHFDLLQDNSVSNEIHSTRSSDSLCHSVPTGSMGCVRYQSHKPGSYARVSSTDYKKDLYSPQSSLKEEQRKNYKRWECACGMAKGDHSGFKEKEQLRCRKEKCPGKTVAVSRRGVDIARMSNSTASATHILTTPRTLIENARTKKSGRSRRKLTCPSPGEKLSPPSIALGGEHVSYMQMVPKCGSFRAFRVIPLQNQPTRRGRTEAALSRMMNSSVLKIQPERWEVCRSSKFCYSVNTSEPSSQTQTMCSDSEFQSSAHLQRKHVSSFASLPVSLKSGSSHSSSRIIHPVEPTDSRQLDTPTGQRFEVSFSDLSNTTDAKQQNSDAVSYSLHSEPFWIRLDHGDFSSRSPEFLHVPKGSKHSCEDSTTDSPKSTVKEAFSSSVSNTKVVLGDSTHLKCKNTAGTQTDSFSMMAYGSFSKMDCDSFRLDSLGSPRLRDMEVSDFTLNRDAKTSGFTQGSYTENISGNLSLGYDHEVSRTSNSCSRTHILGSSHRAHPEPQRSSPSGETRDLSPDWSHPKESRTTREGSTHVYHHSHSLDSYEDETNTLGQDVKTNISLRETKQHSRKNKNLSRVAPDIYNVFSLEKSRISYDYRSQKTQKSSSSARCNTVPRTLLVHSECSPQIRTPQNLPDLLANETYSPGTAVRDNSTDLVKIRSGSPANSFLKQEKFYRQVQSFDKDKQEFMGSFEKVGLQLQQDIIRNRQCDPGLKSDLSSGDDGKQPSNRRPRATIDILQRPKEIKKTSVQTNTALANPGKQIEKKTVSPSARHRSVGKGQTSRKISRPGKRGLVESGGTTDARQDSCPRQAKTHTSASSRDMFLNVNENKLQTAACTQLPPTVLPSAASEQFKMSARSMAKWPEKKYYGRKDVPTEGVSRGDVQKGAEHERKGDLSVSTLHQGSRVKTASVTQKQTCSQTGAASSIKKTQISPSTPSRPSSGLLRTSPQTTSRPSSGLLRTSQTPNKPSSVLLRTSQTPNKPSSVLLRTSPQTTSRPSSVLPFKSAQTTNRPSMIQQRTSTKTPNKPSSVLPRKSPQTPKKPLAVLPRTSPQTPKISPARKALTPPQIPKELTLARSHTSPQTRNKQSNTRTCTPNQPPNKSSLGHRPTSHQSVTGNKQANPVFKKQNSTNENPRTCFRNPHTSHMNPESSNSPFCQTLSRKRITNQGTQEVINAGQIPTSTCPKSVSSSPGHDHLGHRFRQSPVTKTNQKSSSPAHSGSSVAAAKTMIFDKKATDNLNNFEFLQQTPLKVVKNPVDHLSDHTFTLDKTTGHSLAERCSPDCLTSRLNDGISPEFHINQDVNSKWKLDSEIQIGRNAKHPGQNMRTIKKGFSKGNCSPQTEFRGSNTYLSPASRVKSGSRMIQTARHTSTHQHRGSRLIQSTHCTTSSQIRKPVSRRSNNKSSPLNTPKISTGQERETSECVSHVFDIQVSVPGNARSYQDQTALFEDCPQQTPPLSECSDQRQQKRSQCSDGVSCPSNCNEHRTHPVVTDSSFRNQTAKENVNLTFQDWLMNLQSDEYSFRMKTEDEVSDKLSLEEDTGSSRKWEALKFPPSCRKGYSDYQNYIEGSDKTGTWRDVANFHLGSPRSDTASSQTVRVRCMGTPDPRGGSRQRHILQEDCRRGRAAADDHRRYPDASLYPAVKHAVAEVKSSRGIPDFLGPSGSDDQSPATYPEGKEPKEKSSEASEGSQLSSLSWAHLAITETTFSHT